jgi:phage shock protein PspC (stress-responsive transcriptional regulator)
MKAKDKIAAIDEVANLSDGWFGGVLGGVLTLLQWVVGIVVLLVVIWLWPLLRLMLWPLWALLRGVVPSKPVKPEKTVE